MFKKIWFVIERNYWKSLMICIISALIAFALSFLLPKTIGPGAFCFTASIGAGLAFEIGSFAGSFGFIFWGAELFGTKNYDSGMLRATFAVFSIGTAMAFASFFWIMHLPNTCI